MQECQREVTKVVSLVINHIKFTKCVKSDYMFTDMYTLSQKVWFVCLFVLRFYGPVNPMGSCQALSIYLTTRLPGRRSPQSG